MAKVHLTFTRSTTTTDTRYLPFFTVLAIVIVLVVLELNFTPHTLTLYSFYIALIHRADSVFHALVFSDAWQIRAVWLVFHCTSVFCANPVCFCVLAVVLCVLRACSVFPYMAWPSPPHTSAETRLTTQGRTVPFHSCHCHWHNLNLKSFLLAKRVLHIVWALYYVY